MVCANDFDCVLVPGIGNQTCHVLIGFMLCTKQDDNLGSL